MMQAMAGALSVMGFWHMVDLTIGMVVAIFASASEDVIFADGHEAMQFGRTETVFIASFPERLVCRKGEMCEGGLGGRIGRQTCANSSSGRKFRRVPEKYMTFAIFSKWARDQGTDGLYWPQQSRPRRLRQLREVALASGTARNFLSCVRSYQIARRLSF